LRTVRMVVPCQRPDWPGSGEDMRWKALVQAMI
jgi:hypothetical protein